MRFSRSFLFAALGSCITFVVFYAAAFNYQFDAPIAAEYDLPNWSLVKEHLAENAEGKRLLLVADSNVMFGMDSEYVAEALGRPVINMGLHGGLPLDSILGLALRYARAGDIVVLPLVWDYYLRDYRTPNDWLIDQVIAWDRSYFEDLDFFRKLGFVAAVSPSRLYRNMMTYESRVATIKEHPFRKRKSASEILATFQKGTASSTFSYSYMSLNRHGDMLNACGAHFDDAQVYGVSQSSEVNNASLSLLSETIKSLTAKGILVFVAAPVQIDSALTRAPAHQAGINRIWTALHREGIPLLGHPTSFSFPPGAFFDTQWHLNCEHSTERAKLLVAALKAKL